MITHLVPLGGVAVAAFAAGIVSATAPGRAEHALVEQYVTAWRRADYPRMYDLLADSSRRHMSEAAFTAAYTTAAATATLTSLQPGHIGSRSGDLIQVKMRVRTRLFGALRETLDVPLSGSGSSARVRFDASLLFPGVRPGEQLSRQVTLPPRAALLASNGTPLAEGPQRTSPIPALASEVVGTIGPIPAADATTYAAEGYPANAKVGLDGLEHVFEAKLAGRPGGRLLAGTRVLARSQPVAAHAVKTTIDPAIEQAAIAARAGRYAGIAAMNPRTGAVLALSGVAFSALQPPGSTFKIITSTAALQARLVKLTTTFPIMSSATIDGYTLDNANGEACGGTFLNAFAVSCNSVFAPLGARVGAARLVATAERFGFNQPPTIPGAAESQIPSASTIGDSLAVGSSAIGQGMVQTTALQMTDVAATIANHGLRPLPTLLAHQHPRYVRVMGAHVARLVQEMMIAVVQFGTGTSAAVPGVTIAGKTGTAELTDTAGPGGGSPTDTDAWFVGYGPVGRARIVVGALFPSAGAGGQTAAPAVQQVLAAALEPS